MSTSRARFRVGQTIHHKLFDYRGVVACPRKLGQATTDDGGFGKSDFERYLV